MEERTVIKVDLTKDARKDFWWVKEKAAPGVQFVIGRPKGKDTTEVQTVIFDKASYTAAEAKAWLADHDMKSPEADETDESLRFRQRDPGEFQANSFRTITPGQKEAEADHDMITPEALARQCPQCARIVTQEGARGLARLREAHYQHIPHQDKPMESKQRWGGGEPAPGAHAVGSGAGVLMQQILDICKAGADFEIFMTLKAYEEDGKKFIDGVASDDRVDKDNERMSAKAIEKMCKQVNDGQVPLYPTHDSDWDNTMSKTALAEVTPKNELHVKYELDMDHPKAQSLWRALQKGSQLGLSIGGRIINAFPEVNEAAKKLVKVIDDIDLKHIAVTSRPANPRTWIVAIAKSLDWQKAIQVSKGGSMADQIVPVAKPASSGGASAPAGGASDPNPTNPKGGMPNEALAYRFYKAMILRCKESEAEGGNPDYWRKEAEAALKALKEAIRARMKAEGKPEADADEEAEGMARTAEAEAEAEMGGRSVKGDKEIVTVKMTKDQLVKFEKLAEQDRIDNDPVYKALRADLQKTQGLVEEMHKALKGFGVRKGVISNETKDLVEKATKQDIASITKSETYQKADPKQRRKMLEESTALALKAVQGMAKDTGIDPFRH